MSGLSDAIDHLREILESTTDESISDLSDEQIVMFATDQIAALELDNSFYEIAIANDITGPDFERWHAAALEKLSQLEEGEELDEEGLLALLKNIRN